MITKLFTIPDYAQRVGVSRTYIYKLQKQGKIEFVVEDGKKKVDAKKVDKITKYFEAGRHISNVNQKSGGKKKQARTEPNESEVAGVEFSKETPTEDLDHIKLYEQTRKLRIENDKKEEILIDAQVATFEYFELARRARDTILNSASLIAKLTENKNQRERELIIAEELKKCLTSLPAEYAK